MHLAFKMLHLYCSPLYEVYQQSTRKLSHGRHSFDVISADVSMQSDDMMY